MPLLEISCVDKRWPVSIVLSKSTGEISSAIEENHSLTANEEGSVFKSLEGLFNFNP